MTHQDLLRCSRAKQATACTAQLKPIGGHFVQAGCALLHVLAWGCPVCELVIECAHDDTICVKDGALTHRESYSFKTAVLPRPRRPRP